MPFIRLRSPGRGCSPGAKDDCAMPGRLVSPMARRAEMSPRHARSFGAGSHARARASGAAIVRLCGVSRQRSARLRGSGQQGERRAERVTFALSADSRGRGEPRLKGAICASPDRHTSLAIRRARRLSRSYRRPKQIDVSRRLPTQDAADGMRADKREKRHDVGRRDARSGARRRLSIL